MNISPSTSLPSQTAGIPSQTAGSSSATSGVEQLQNTNRADNNARRERVQNIQQDQAQTQQANNSSREQRLEADEETLALIEEQYQASQQEANTQVLSRQNSTENNSSANNGRSNTIYDQPSQQNNTAISAYQGVDNISQRESIEQQFGVDLYA